MRYFRADARLAERRVTRGPCFDAVLRVHDASVLMGRLRMHLNLIIRTGPHGCTFTYLTRPDADRARTPFRLHSCGRADPRVSRMCPMSGSCSLRNVPILFSVLYGLHETNGI